MNHPDWYWTWAITNFADQAVILPLTAVVAVVLFLKWRWGSYIWCLCVATTLLLTVALKLALYILVSFLPFSIGMRSPSSHVAMGAIVYGIIISLIIGRGYATFNITLISSTIVAIILASTRLMLEVHTKLEVIIGMIIGVIGAVTFTVLANRYPRKISPGYLAVATMMVALIFHGFIFHGEDVIKNISIIISYHIKLMYNSFHA